MVLPPLRHPMDVPRKFPMPSHGMLHLPTTYENCSNNNDRIPIAIPRLSHTFQLTDKLSVQCKDQISSSDKTKSRQSQWCDQVRNLKQHSKIGYSKSGQKEHKPFGKFSSHKAKEGVASTGELPNRRRVSFNVGNHPTNKAASIDISSSNSSSTSRKSATINSALDRTSNHKCNRIPTIVKKSKLRRLYWSAKEVKQIRHDAHQEATVFRTHYPVIAKQVDRLFEESCSIKNKPGTREPEEDEEHEEILREFLQDWAASDMRGLEESVGAQNMFRQDRNMAVGSVLAYQESLRNRTGNAAAGQIAEKLRARSESASHRAVMFSMYMALGDALVVAADCNYICGY